MRRAIAAILILGAGCNSILGNGNFHGPGGDDGDDGPGDGGVDGCAAMGKKPTSVSGTVYTPNGLLPLYNALVYVPTTTLDPIPEGPTGPVCASGEPLVHTFTDASGTFKLDNVPAVDNLRLVIQLGKWRREIMIPRTPACTDTALAAADTRLPKNSAEGHLPHIALTTGGPETIECLARDIGVDDAEITTGSGSGRIHLYAGPGGTTQFAAGGALESLNAMFGRMMLYDMLFFGCDGMQTPKPAGAQQELLQFVNTGGWAWLTHFQSGWITPPSPFPMLAQFDQTLPQPQGIVQATIDTTMPTGAAFASWMTGVAGSAQPGLVAIQNGRNTCQSVNASQQVKRLLFLDPPTASGLNGIQAWSWATPAGGRLLFADIHLQPNALGPSPFPTECPTTALSPQQKAVIFQTFDTPAVICAN